MAEPRESVVVKEAVADARSDDQAVSADAKISQLEALLKEFPDIFERQPELLDNLQLHHSSGGAVSLIERQVRQLRDSNSEMRQRLQLLLNNARENEQRVGMLNRLACAMLESGSLEALLDTLGRHLESDFGIGRWRLYHAGASALESAAHAQRLPESGPCRAALENPLRTGQVECAALDESLAEALFPQSAPPPGSVAIVPLLQMTPSTLLVLASDDAGKFRPNAGSVLLVMLGEMLAAGIKRFAAE